MPLKIPFELHSHDRNYTERSYIFHWNVIHFLYVAVPSNDLILFAEWVNEPVYHFSTETFFFCMHSVIFGEKSTMKFISVVFSSLHFFYLKNMWILIDKYHVPIMYVNIFANAIFHSNHNWCNYCKHCSGDKQKKTITSLYWN